MQFIWRKLTKCQSSHLYINVKNGRFGIFPTIIYYLGVGKMWELAFSLLYILLILGRKNARSLIFPTPIYYYRGSVIYMGEGVSRVWAARWPEMQLDHPPQLKKKAHPPKFLLNPPPPNREPPIWPPLKKNCIDHTSKKNARSCIYLKFLLPLTLLPYQVLSYRMFSGQDVLHIHLFMCKFAHW